MDKIEVVKQKGRGVNHTSLIVFTEGERKGELLGSVYHNTKVITLVSAKYMPLTPELLIGIGEAFKTFKW